MSDTPGHDTHPAMTDNIQMCVVKNKMKHVLPHLVKAHCSIKIMLSIVGTKKIVIGDHGIVKLRILFQCHLNHLNRDSDSKVTIICLKRNQQIANLLVNPSVTTGGPPLHRPKCSHW